MKTLTIIRHAESERNQQNKGRYSVFSGQFDCGLSNNGLREARNLGKNFSHSFDIAYISDSVRCIETFKQLKSSVGSIVYTNLLRERSLGEFEGLSVEEFLKNKNFSDYWPSGKYSDFRHSFINKAPKGENYCDVCLRLEELISTIKSNEDCEILIVSHLVTIRCLLYLLGVLDNITVFQRFIDNCEVIRVEMRGI